MNGGGHFISVRGYSDQGIVDVQDPWYGASTVDYISFRNSLPWVRKMDPFVSDRTTRFTFLGGSRRKLSSRRLACLCNSPLRLQISMS